MYVKLKARIVCQVELEEGEKEHMSAKKK